MMKKSLIFILILSLILPINCLSLNLEKNFESDITSDLMNVASSDALDSVPLYNDSGKQIGVSFYGFSEKNEEYFQEIYNVFYDNKITHISFSTGKNWLIDASTISKDDNPDVKGESDVMFTLYDTAHNPVKTFLYGGNGVDDAYYYEDYGLAFFSCDENNNLDGYIFTIYTESTDIVGVVPGYVMVKIDLDGNIVWQKNRLLANKSFSADGKMYFRENRQILTRYEWYRDKPVGEVWSVDTGIYLDDYKCIVSYNKAGVVDGVVALSYGNADKNVVMIKYDLDGNFVWQDKYNPTEYGGVLSISAEMVDSDGDFNGYLVLARQNNCPAPYMRREENEEFSKSSPTIKKLANKNDACFNYKFFRYTYPSYEIVKDKTDEGDITVGDNAYPGEVVKIKVTPKEGYVLKRIVVKDENGKEIEVSKDGTFVMPEGKVTVTAIYSRITNPETVSACYVVLGIILLISIGTLVVQKKEENV